MAGSWVQDQHCYSGCPPRIATDCGLIQGFSSPLESGSYNWTSVNLFMVPLGTSVIVLRHSDLHRTLSSLSAMYDVVTSSRPLRIWTRSFACIHLGQCSINCNRRSNSRCSGVWARLRENPRKTEISEYPRIRWEEEGCLPTSTSCVAQCSTREPMSGSRDIWRMNTNENSPLPDKTRCQHHIKASGLIRCRHGL